MIVYLHIAKTAGTTMLHYMERHCKTFQVKSWWISDWRIPDDTECLFSHCPYGEPEKHLTGDFQYITFLRDPIERVISNYYHVLNEPTHPQFYDYLKFSLADIVQADEFSTFDNGMVRLIAGRRDIGNLLLVDKVTEDDLEQAKKNISSFVAVGFLDTFDADLARFANIFGWNDLKYNWYRKGRRPAMDNIEPAVLNVIKKQNKFDSDLVDFARLKFGKTNMEFVR